MNLNKQESPILKTDNDNFTHWPVLHKLAVQSKKADFSALKDIKYCNINLLQKVVPLVVQREGSASGH